MLRRTAPPPGMNRRPEPSPFGLLQFGIFDNIQDVQLLPSPLVRILFPLQLRNQLSPEDTRGKLDALTSRSADLHKGENGRLLHERQVVLKRVNLDIKNSLLSGCLSNEPVEGATLFEQLWKHGYKADKYPGEI